MSHGYVYGEREAQPVYSTEPECHEEKEIQCHKKPIHTKGKIPRSVCKTVEDTTYIEECEETFTTHCHTAHSHVHHTSAIVGTESYISHGKQKREAQAESEPTLGYTNEPKCHAKKDRHCHKRPVQSFHQIPRQVCVQVPRQVCVPYEVKVPYEVCGHSHVHVEQYANDLVYGY